MTLTIGATHRADEARLMADNMADLESKRMMLEVAEGYERLAERAKERAASAKEVEVGRR